MRVPAPRRERPGARRRAARRARVALEDGRERAARRAVPDAELAFRVAARREDTKPARRAGGGARAQNAVREPRGDRVHAQAAETHERHRHGPQCLYERGAEPKLSVEIAAPRPEAPALVQCENVLHPRVHRDEAQRP